MLEQRIEKLELQNAELEKKITEVKVGLSLFLETYKEWLHNRINRDEDFKDAFITISSIVDNHHEVLKAVLKATGVGVKLKDINQEVLNRVSEDLSQELQKSITKENRDTLVRRVKIIISFGNALLEKLSDKFKYRNWFNKDFKVDDRSKEELQDFLKSFSEEVESYKS